MKRRRLALLFALLVTTGVHAHDISGDGVDDDADLQIMRDAFYGYDARADLDGDGRVNFADLALLRAGRDGLGSHVTPAALPTMTLLPAVQDVPFLNDFVLELWMDFTTEPTLGGGTDVHFDPAALRYVTFEFDAGLGDDPAFRRLPDLEAPGVLNALAFGAFQGLTGPALVGRFTFHARGAAGLTALTMAADDIDGIAGPFVSKITFVPMDVSFIGADVNVVEGPLPVIEIEHRLLSFGTVRLGHMTRRRVSVSNAGDLPLRLGQAGAINPLSTPFRIEADNCAMRTLLPGTECAITVSMNPPMSGSFSDAFSISSGDPVTPVVNVGLTGIGTEQLGLDAIGLVHGTGRCENLATGEVVERPAGNRSEFNCEAEGFHASPNDPVSVGFRGFAHAGDIAAGIANGMAVASVRCENATTGQSIDIGQPLGLRGWSCVDAGLVVTTGDDIVMTAAGTAD